MASVIIKQQIWVEHYNDSTSMDRYSTVSMMEIKFEGNKGTMRSGDQREAQR